jgi:molybdopterin converting factor subunit 1
MESGSNRLTCRRVKELWSRILLKMRVRVLYFGVLKESLGREGELVELAEGSSVADLMERYEEKGADWMRSIAVAVNREYARREDVLRDGDEVALLPPVSGGAR